MSNKIVVILYNNSSIFIKIEKYFCSNEQTAVGLLQELTEQLAKISFANLSVAFWSSSDIWAGPTFGQAELKFLPADHIFDDLIYPVRAVYALYSDYISRYKQAQLGIWPRVHPSVKSATIEQQAEAERMNVLLYETALNNYFREVQILVDILKIPSLEKHFDWMSKEDFNKFMNAPNPG